MTEQSPDPQIGMRLLIAPSKETAALGVTEPYWVEITEIDADGAVTTSDDDGYPETIDAETWISEVEPRLLEVQPPRASEGILDEPEPAKAPEEEDVLDEEEDEAELSNAGYVARNAEANAQAAKNLGLDPRRVMQVGESEKTLIDLANLINRQDEIDAEVRKLMECRAEVGFATSVLLKKIAKDRLIQEIPFGKPSKPDPTPDPMLQALAEEIPDPPEIEPPPTEEMPKTQQQAIAEEVARQASNESYEEASRLEMNVRIGQVRGISPNMALRMAEKDIKTLGQFQQIFTETQDGPKNWWDGMNYINDIKAAKILDCVEAHWLRFRKKYGRK